MKRLLIVFMAVTALIAGASHSAQAGCPTRANSLEAFAGCMVPMKGTIGTASVYSSGKYERDTRLLMSALMRSNFSQPAPVPMSYSSYSSSYIYPALFMNLYFAAHSSYRNNWFRFASFYSPYYRYNPNMWMYAYYVR